MNIKELLEDTALLYEKKSDKDKKEKENKKKSKKKQGKDDWLISLCNSSRPDHTLGASNLSSCKSRGLRARSTGKSEIIGGKRQKLDGKKIKGKKYGGALPDYS